MAASSLRASNVPGVNINLPHSKNAPKSDAPPYQFELFQLSSERFKNIHHERSWVYKRSAFGLGSEPFRAFRTISESDIDAFSLINKKKYISQTQNNSTNDSKTTKA